MPGYGSKVWPAPAGAVWHSGTATVARGPCQGGPATAGPSGHTWHVEFGVLAPHQWRGGAAGVARLRLHHPAIPSRHHLAWQPRAGGKGLLPRQPSYCSTGQPGLASDAQCGGPSLVARGHCHCGSAMAVLAGWPRQAPSIAVSLRRQRRDDAGAARQWPYWPVGPGRRSPTQRPAPAARGRCQGDLAMAAPSGRTCQALSGVTARCQRQGGASGAAWLQCNCPAGLGRRRPALRPHADSEGALLGWPGYSVTVWPDLSGAVWCDSPVPTARGCFWCGLATMQLSGWPRQVPSGATAPHRQQGSAAGMARLQWHGLAGPGTCHPVLWTSASSEGVFLVWLGFGSMVWLALAGQSSAAARSQWRGTAAGAARLQQHWPAGPRRHNSAQWPGTGGEEVLVGQPGYDGTVWPALAFAILHSSLVVAVKGQCQSSPATATPPSRPQQEQPGAAVQCQQLGSTVGAAQLLWHHLTGPGRSHLVLRTSAGNEGALSGWPGYGSTIWPTPAGAV